MFNRLEYTRDWQQTHSEGTPNRSPPDSRTPRNMDAGNYYRGNFREHDRGGFDNNAYSQELQEFPKRQDVYAIPRPEHRRQDVFQDNPNRGRNGNYGSEISYPASEQRRNLYRDNPNGEWGQRNPSGNMYSDYDRTGQQRTPHQSGQSPYDARPPDTQPYGPPVDQSRNIGNNYSEIPTRGNEAYYYQRQMPHQDRREPSKGERNSDIKDQRQNFAQNRKEQEYQSNFRNFYNEPEEPPSWMKRISQSKDYDNDADSVSTTSLNPETSSCAKTAYFTTRLFAMFIVLWDLANDWVVVASGPSPFYDFRDDDLNSPLECSINNGTLEMLQANSTLNVDDSICRSTVEIWTALAVFALLGSVLTICQSLNILMEMLNVCRRRKVFQIIDSQNEVCIVIYLTQLPQLAMLSALLFVCKCTSANIDNNVFNSIVFSTFVSATLGSTIRFCTAFEGFVSRTGCCHQWWRCCCCADHISNDATINCCHALDAPCLPCCCTLRCRRCTFSVVPWCVDLVKMFSCFCYCCDDKDTRYGIRLVNLFGLLLLWLAFALHILTFATN